MIPFCAAALIQIQAVNIPNHPYINTVPTFEGREVCKDSETTFHIYPEVETIPGPYKNSIELINPNGTYTVVAIGSNPLCTGVVKVVIP